MEQEKRLSSLQKANPQVRVSTIASLATLLQYYTQVYQKCLKQLEKVSQVL